MQATMLILVFSLRQLMVPDDLRPIAYTSESFPDMQQRLSATEKESFALCQSVLKFDLYLRGAQGILCCDHKSLEPFLSWGIKIPKLDHWSMKFSDYNQTFIHIKGTDNIQMDTISRLKTLEIYTHPLENPKTAALNNTEECIAEVVANKIQT